MSRITHPNTRRVLLDDLKRLDRMIEDKRGMLHIALAAEEIGVLDRINIAGGFTTIAKELEELWSKKGGKRT
jgi:hypothetical protein